MNKQLIKDFGVLLNDTRIGLCNVRSDKSRLTGYGDIGDGSGVIIGEIVWASGNGSYLTMLRNVHLTYDSLLTIVRAVYAAHPTRIMRDVLYSVKYNTRIDSFTFAVTGGSNFELYGVKHRRISAALRNELEYYLDKCDVEYVTQYCDAYINHADKQGGFTFRI